MRTLFEITDGAKNGQKPTHDECYFAMLALDALSTFSNSDIRRIYEKAKGTKLGPYVNLFCEDNFRRIKTTLRADPQKWLGDYIPGNLKYDKNRKIALKIFEAAMRGELPTQKNLPIKPPKRD